MNADGRVGGGRRGDINSVVVTGTPLWVGVVGNQWWAGGHWSTRLTDSGRAPNR